MDRNVIGLVFADHSYPQLYPRAPMKNGILKETDGFDIVVDGTNRSFHDIYDVALGAARELKRLNRTSVVQIRTRADGSIREMLEDGRIR